MVKAEVCSLCMHYEADMYRSSRHFPCHATLVGLTLENCSIAVTQINRSKLTLTRTGALHELEFELNGSRIGGLYADCILLFRCDEVS